MSKWSKSYFLTHPLIGKMLFYSRFLLSILLLLSFFCELNTAFSFFFHSIDFHFSHFQGNVIFALPLRVGLFSYILNPRIGINLLPPLSISAFQGKYHEYLGIDFVMYWENFRLTWIQPRLIFNLICLLSLQRRQTNLTDG